MFEKLNRTGDRRALMFFVVSQRAEQPRPQRRRASDMLAYLRRARVCVCPCQLIVICVFMGVAFIWSSGARKSIDGISIDLVRWGTARNGCAVQCADARRCRA